MKVKSKRIGLLFILLFIAMTVVVCTVPKADAQTYQDNQTPQTVESDTLNEELANEPPAADDLTEADDSSVTKSENQSDGDSISNKSENDNIDPINANKSQAPGKQKFSATSEPEPVDATTVNVTPSLEKVVTGDEPMDPGVFIFLLKAISNTAGYEITDMPMPEGAEAGVARLIVEGPGNFEFGQITITKPGQYVYELSEENVGEDGYTYDTAIYRFLWNVTNVDNILSAESTIADQEGKVVETATFTNNFAYDDSPLDPDDNDSDVIDEKDSVKKTTVKTKAAATGDLGALPLAYALLFASLLTCLAVYRRAR